MTASKATVFLTIIFLTLISALVYLAMIGNVWATGILFSGWTLVCVVIGYGLAVYQQKQAADREQQAFIANTKENLGIMMAAQKVQNLQNQTVMQQLGQAARLPQPGGLDMSKMLSIEDGIFNELED